MNRPHQFCSLDTPTATVALSKEELDTIIMVNPNMADQVASSEPTVGIALTQFTHPNPLQMEKSMTYRLIYTHPNQPCSDWTEDVKSLLDYVEQRPNWVQKIHVEDEKGNAIVREGWAVPLGRPVYRLEPNGVLVRLVLVINASGKPMFVPKEEAYLYNGNDNEGLAVFGFPPDATADDINNLLDPLVPYYDGGREFLIRKSEADDLERFDEFEAAAETADQMDKLYSTLSNDELLVGFIDKEA